jgi:hypothetical protein
LGQGGGEGGGHGDGPVGVGVGEQDRELVASRAGEQVALVQLVLEAGANCAEQVVSHVVAAAVVDFLEAVQVAQ